MKFFQKRAVAAVVLILAIVAGVVIGQAKKPDTGGQASTAIVGSYTYVYDYAGVLTDETMEHIDAMNASLFAQTGAQILVSVVNSTGGADIMDYASDLGNSYGVGSAERNNGVVMLLALDNISQSGLMGDYCVVVGTGLESHADDFMSLQSYYLENDFAAGEYDAGVKATFDAFIAGSPTSTASRSGRGISLPSGRPIPAAAGTTIRRPTAMWRRPLGPW